MKKKIVCLLLSFSLLLSSALAGEFSAYAACSHKSYITYYDSAENKFYQKCCSCQLQSEISGSSKSFAYADPIFVHKGENEITFSLSQVLSKCQSGAVSVTTSSEISILSGEWLMSSCLINFFDADKGRGVFFLSKSASVSDKIIKLRFNVSDSAEDGAMAYIKLDSLMYNARQNIIAYSVPIYIVSEHKYENNICTVCGLGGSTEENGCKWSSYGDTITFTGNNSGDLSFNGAPWKSLAPRIKKVVFNGNIKEIPENTFQNAGNPEIVEILGNPGITLPETFKGKVMGFSGTKAEEYCKKEDIKFENIEEFQPKGYQKALDGSTDFRIDSQMRWAEYYDRAGFEIIGTNDDGNGNILEMTKDVEIKTVYKSISGKDENGNVITVFTPEKDCYASAIRMTGLPKITDNRRIEFEIKPYVYNIYSDEKIYLEATYIAYTKDGITKFIPIEK